MKQFVTNTKFFTLAVTPVALAVIITAPAQGTTNFDTPGDFDVTTALDDVVISNGADVTFLPTGSATGPATTDAFASPGVELQENSGLTVAGGSIVGSPRIGLGGFAGYGIGGFAATGSTLLISSGSVTGGAGIDDTVASNDAIRLSGADITITGGTIAGGVNPTNPNGGQALNISNGTLDISGGDFIGQNTTTLNLFQVSGTISGGSFTTLAQTQILALGSFDTPATLDITGGDWELGSLISVGEGTTLNLFGTGFQTELTDIGNGLLRDVLTGTLDDGSPIEFVLNPNSTGTINLIPEPTSLALLGMGGVAVLTRRRRG